MRTVEQLDEIIKKVQDMLIAEGLSYAELSTIISELYVRHLVARTAQVIEDRMKKASKEE